MGSCSSRVASPYGKRLDTVHSTRNAYKIFWSVGTETQDLRRSSGDLANKPTENNAVHEGAILGIARCGDGFYCGGKRWGSALELGFEGTTILCLRQQRQASMSILPCMLTTRIEEFTCR